MVMVLMIMVVMLTDIWLGKSRIICHSILYRSFSVIFFSEWALIMHPAQETPKFIIYHAVP